MAGLWAALAHLPALAVRLLDLVADWQRRRDEAASRKRLDTEVRADVAQEIEAAQAQSEKETRDAMDRAHDVVPDRAAAADRLRRGDF